MIAAFYSVPASLFRIYGGRLSDRYGARAVLYWTFGVSVFCTFLLSYPPTTYIIDGVDGPITFSTSMGLVPFVVTLFVLGFFMSLGKAAVFKHIPVYYPNHVGAVGGLVGMIGGLGGFVLPLAFGVLDDLTGVWTSCFALLFLLVVDRLRLDARDGPAHGDRGPARRPEPRRCPSCPRWWASASPASSCRRAPARSPTGGRRIRRSGPRPGGRSPGATSGSRPTACCSPSRSGWSGRWSSPGCRRSASPSPPTSSSGSRRCRGSRGRRLRIFYAFLVPIFGGRLWTTISTASLLIPAFGIGYAVQNPETPVS